jgi:hypothetical protein
MVKQDAVKKDATGAIKTEAATKEAGTGIYLKNALILLPAVLGVFIILGIGTYKEILGKNYASIYWTGIPILIYLISTGSCIIAQSVACSTVRMEIIVQSTWQIILYVLFALGISEFAIVRAPVVSITPYKELKGISSIVEIERLNPGIQEKATAYWVFWITLFGQMAIIGKTTLCKS